MYTKQMEAHVADLITKRHPECTAYQLTLTEVEFSGFKAVSVVIGEPLTESDVTYIKSQLIVNKEHPKVGLYSNLVMGELCDKEAAKRAYEAAVSLLEASLRPRDIPEVDKPNDYIFIYYIPKDDPEVFILDRSVSRGVLGLRRAKELVGGHLSRGHEAFYSIGSTISKPALY